jgi:outer membrane protein OmpA-like peptidoglycan-associated protein
MRGLLHMAHRLSGPFATLCFFACSATQPIPTPPAEPTRTPVVTTKPVEAPTETGAVTQAASETPQDAPTADGNARKEFKLEESSTARETHGVKPSKIKATRTEAALKFVVVDKDTGPVKGVVVKLSTAQGQNYYTEETDAEGYAEVLVPVATNYDLTYLSLGRRDVAATLPISDKPSQTIKLTVRYKFHRPPALPAPKVEPGVAPEVERPRFVLKGVEFDTGKATVRPQSFPQLDEVVEYMAHKLSAKIEVSGHTDNVGDPKVNKSLSNKRALAVRAYLVSKGIEEGRIEALGYGDERPIADNDSDANRQKNRRIEVTEK